MAKSAICVEDPRDVALLRMAEGAAFGDTIMPSGFKVPTAPKGQAYYPVLNRDGWALVLQDLAPRHRERAGS